MISLFYGDALRTTHKFPVILLKNPNVLTSRQICHQLYYLGNINATKTSAYEVESRTDVWGGDLYDDAVPSAPTAVRERAMENCQRGSSASSGYGRGISCVCGRTPRKRFACANRAEYHAVRGDE